MQDLENKLNEVFVKNAPFQIPENIRKWIAEYAWVFALVGLIFGVLGVFSLLAILGIASVLGFGVVEVRHTLAFAWLSLIALAVYTAVLAVAVPQLKAKKAKGWDLLYYSALAYFVYDVVYTLSYTSSSAVFSLFWNFISLAISLYVLFQVRSYFKGSRPAAAPKKK